jgi:glutamate dehydrogenase
VSDTIEQSAPATTTSELHPKVEEMLDRIGREAEAGSGAEPERGAALRAFARALLRRLADDDLRAITADELFALATSAFAFADSRGLEASAVRVFNADPEVHGYRCHGTVIEVATDDSPFLVDSVSEELTARGLTIKQLLHPVIGAVRDDRGRLVRVLPGREAEHRESFMHFEVDRTLGDDVNAELEARVRRILRDVSLVVRDFEPMQDRVRDMMELASAAEVRYPAEVVGEVARFLDWLLQLNFVLLGYREYELLETKEGRAIRAVPGSGLGILSDVGKSTFSELTLLSTLAPDVRNRIEDGELLIYSKTQAYSTVHRRARMDYIGVRTLAPDGSIVGEARLIGLFTSKAYMEPVAKTPLLHHKLEQLIAAEDLIPGSHDYKAIVALFESFPKDELFQASAEEIRRLVVGLLQLEKHGGIRVLIRRDLYGRNVSVVVALPRDRFNADLRKRLQGLFLARFNGTTIDYHLSLGETESARIFFTIHVAPGVPIPDVRYEELEREVERLARTWEDDLLDALTGRVGAGRALVLLEEYAPRFPEYYKANDEWELVVDDVLMLEKLEASTEGFLVGVGNETKGERLTRVKLYKTGGKVDLSDFMPILEALGLRVVEEVPTAVSGDGRVYIHDFGVLDSRGAVLELGEAADRVTDTIAAVWRGDCDSDSLNRLVTLSSLTWWQVRILRALRNYRMRVSARYTENYRNDAMAAYPSIAERLVRMFEARFDPIRSATEEEIDEIRQAIHKDLRGVSSLDQDNILRHLLGTIEAIVRTNAYLSDRSYLSFKLLSERVPEMPKPTPLYEIWVYSTEMEAIHLRAGMVARGGIRWSDRREDFRTEVLGLMKAQKVKNAVIVPDGSKGGFVLKRTSVAPEQVKEEVARQYATFMEGLLDVTDNLEKGDVVHPEGVRGMDGPDPYLVVAADRGTAPLSDAANDISQRYGYWLGDAFASGGSHGYDHKALGITARGAWESVKRHFRELGLDPMTEPFTAIGIGDMSGDVFGNGMLYTDRIRLVAAFDHRHVFLDPEPDPVTSFAERKRLFEMPASSWGDYDRSVLSVGADVIDRAAKWVTLSTEAREALAIPDGTPAEMTPADVIRWVLQAPVDLLWNGGIGTYVKATDEGHTEVGDRANDPVRINGNQVRARVVGEGGNLGFTQRGRIEYALTGGRVNTDFIDNSAGVDTSDREVNLKILLGLAVERGELATDERNSLLEACTDDVIRRVLYDNYLQAQILSQEVTIAAERNEACEDLMLQLEAEGELDRAVEFLPTSDEMAERRGRGEGLTRPELALLVAYAKRSIKRDLLEADLPDSEYLEQDLARYFPEKVVDRFRSVLAEHPLRRELVATIVSNDVVNSQGVTFVSRLVAETGATPTEVVRAFRIARDIVDAVSRWDAVESLDGKIDPETQNELMTGVDRLVESSARWYLVRAPGLRLGEAVDQARAAFRELSSVIEQIGPEAWREQRDREAVRLTGEGIPEELARRHAFQDELVHGPDIISVSRATGRAVLEVARGFFLLGERLDIDWLEQRLAEQPAKTRWQRWALHSMEDDLYTIRREIIETVLEHAGGRPIDEAVDAFLEDRSAAYGRLQRFMRSLAMEGVTGLSQLTVALRQLRSLVS